MECSTVTSCVLLTVLLSSLAQQVAGSPPSKENRSSPPDPAAVFASGRPVPGEAMLMVRDYVKQGDTLLGERLKESFSSLKELLFEGDAHLKERVLESVSQLKAQLKERDDQLKEELDEDVALLKDRLAKGQSHVKEQLAEEIARTTEDLTEQKHALDTLRQTVKQWTQSSASSAMMDELKQQMTLLQEDLKATKQQLSSTQTELQKTKSSEEELQKTLEQLQSEVQANTAVRAQLQAAEKEIRSLRADLDSFQSTDSNLSLPQSFQVGSTFIRWGRNTCPANTSLVYAGVAGGTYYDHTGGAFNYLCLVMDPQVDNTTVPSQVNYLFGAEYESILVHDDQDVVCSVCLAPHAITLMIAATLTCPDGWTIQYQGHLASERHVHKGRTEYVCLDLVREHRHGGHVSNDGALFYLVVPSCGSLPCPPYVTNKVVTCVVCSK